MKGKTKQLSSSLSIINTCQHLYMDSIKRKLKRITQFKTWKITQFNTNSTNNNSPCKEDKGNTDTKKLTKQITPRGYFSVYVGPEKQRFLIKTEFANHRLFKLLLEDAELEYGFNSEGPLLLPCDVDFFYKVLAEMECGGDHDAISSSPACNSLVLCSPYGRSSSYHSKVNGVYMPL